MTSFSALLFFVKFPVAGRVKTRLAATLGDLRAAEIYRRLVAHICAQLPTDVEITAMFDPPEQQVEIEEWLKPLCPALQFSPQSPGDLGNRLCNAFGRAFARQKTKVAAIGSDCVDLTIPIFEETWAALDKCDCVIGPTSDGGYYLIALRRPAPVLFRNIPWSSDAVFHQTLTRAADARLTVHLLPRLSDIDTEHDWQRVEQRLSG